MKFYCEYFNLGAGKWHTIEVDADSYKQAVESAQKLKNRKMDKVWIEAQQAEQIIDDENLLFEMDANGIDEIQIKQGVNIKNTYTRKQIEESIFSRNSINKLSAKESLSGLFD